MLLNHRSLCLLLLGLYSALSAAPSEPPLQSAPSPLIQSQGNTTYTIDPVNPKAPVHENVRIVGNSLVRGEMHVKSVKGLVVTDNTSTPNALHVTADPSCSEVVIERNSLSE